MNAQKQCMAVVEGNAPELPNYETSPGIPGSITDIIKFDSALPPERRRLNFISSYQGQTDYRGLDGTGRLSFRWGKVPWVWGFQKPGEKYWNYETEEEFQRDINGRWGLLTDGGNPVGPTTLEVFRAEYLSNAVTGYYDHEKKDWVVCGPTTEKRGTASWQRREQAAR